MLVSFIIPSYNSAHTISRCLDSIYALSVKEEEYEVLFIDDCSTDNTCDVVREYQSVHPNITLLRQPKNNRQGAARNRGVEIAKGDYICFVDSDDAVAEGLVNAIHKARELHTDMVVTRSARKTKEEELNEGPLLPFANGEIFSGIALHQAQEYWHISVCSFIYNADWLRKVNYPFTEGVLYEDSDFVAVHLYYAQRITYSSELGHIYYYREGSTTHSTSHKNMTDFLYLGLRMLSFYNLICQDLDQRQNHNELLNTFIDGVLDGACSNVTRPFHRLYRLSSAKEIIAFYNHIDAKVNRRAIYDDAHLRKYSYYWKSVLVHIGFKHKYLSIILNTILSYAYRLYVKMRKDTI